MIRFDLRISNTTVPVALALCLLGSVNARADFHLYVNNVFSSSGVSAPGGPAPWVDAFFQDVTPGTVRLTLSDVGLSSGEFISEFYFNLNPADNPSDLAINYVMSSGSFTLPTILQQADHFQADGDGKYDVNLSFATSGSGMQRFDGTDSVTYLITGITNLMASDFLYGSAHGGGTGMWYAAAHIQGIDSGSGTGSVWAAPLDYTPVPEPSTALLLVLSAGLWYGRWSTASRIRRS
jgi:hypothetical protein